MFERDGRGGGRRGLYIAEETAILQKASQPSHTPHQYGMLSRSNSLEVLALPRLKKLNDYWPRQEPTS